MATEEEFNRILGLHAEDEYGTDMGRNGGLREEPGRHDPQGANGREPAPQPAGSPLPMGLSGRPLSGRGEWTGTRTTAPPPGRALSASKSAEADHSSGMQWVMGVVKQAVPFVQKLLPLLDGQIATAVGNLIAARPHTPAPMPRVDLEPIENGLADLHIQQATLKDQLIEQNTALKRVEDHLEMVREATDRNTLEQQELVEDLKAMTGRVNLLALVFLGLLVISLLLNIFLFLHIQRVLP